MIRLYYRVDPEKLTDREWAKLFEEYRFVKQMERDNLSTAIHNVAADILSQLFKKE